MEALRKSVAGCASSLHDWDGVAERLVPARLGHEGGVEREVDVVLNGVDGVTSRRCVCVSFKIQRKEKEKRVGTDTPHALFFKFRLAIGRDWVVSQKIRRSG